MKNVAVLEDEKSAIDLLLKYLKRFEKEKDETFNVAYYTDASSFLANYNVNFDIIFLDIELPDINGMDVAKRIRDLDESVILIFVTNMSQYAVSGYEVDAYDFIVKPVSYYNFALKMQRVIEHIRKNEDVKIKVNTEKGLVCILVSQLKYVEVMNHNLVFHCTDGNYTSYGTLKKVAELLPEKSFKKCNNCYLVNLRYVSAVKGFNVIIDNESIQISQSKRKEFLKAIADYLGGGI